jgi:hypothetical protein
MKTYIVIIMFVSVVRTVHTIIHSKEERDDTGVIANWLFFLTQLLAYVMVVSLWIKN